MDILGDFDEEEPIEKRFEDLCQELCIEGTIREEAWEKYKDVWTNYAVDGDQLQWLVCSLYECCRKSSSDSLPGNVVENAYISLTRLLRTAKMSLVQFFHRIKKWADMTDMQEEMRDRIDRLESQFAVSSVNFKKYGPVFCCLFRMTSQIGETGSAGDDAASGRSGKGTTKFKKACSANDLFHFTWSLFVKVKANFPAIGDDLVNSFHLLLCCLDWIYGNVLMAGRKDLISPEFRGLPRDFQNKDWRAPEVLPCVLRAICDENDVNFVECKTIKEHFFKPYLKKLFNKDVLKGREVSLSGVLESANFEVSNRAINNLYEEYIMGTGDFDERVFLGANAAEEIGTTAIHRHTVVSNAVLDNSLAPTARRYMQEASDPGHPLGTPAPNRRNSNQQFGSSGGIISRLASGINFNNPESRGQHLSQLQGLLIGRSRDPSEALVGLLEAHCCPNPLAEIEARVDQLGATFCNAYTGGDEAYEDSAYQRLTLAQTLYYQALENILLDEINKFERRTEVTGRRVKADLTGLMSTDRFHRSLMACCLEVVLLSCDSGRHFPWVLDSLKLEAFHFYKVVEVVIKNVDFPREIVKYLNQVVEHILDTYAWKSDSPLWDALRGTPKAPSIEEVTHPDKIDQDSKPSGNGGGPVHKLIMDSSVGVSMSPGKIIRPATVKRSWVTEGDESARAAAQLLGSSGLGGGAMDTEESDERQTVRHDSVAIFFRQVYYLASLRLRDICDRLNLTKDYLAKVWTSFEHVLVYETDMMRDRNLDQVLLCCLYSIARVACAKQLNFVDIIQAYRMQPQATKEIYRRVLLDRSSQATGATTRSKGSQGTSPKRPTPGSTLLEERGDISKFYNLLFLPRMCAFVKKFATSFTLTAVSHNGGPTLSPLPVRNLDTGASTSMLPSRRLASNRNIFISPVKNHVTMSPKRMVFSVSNSPSKDLREINNMISTAERKVIMANMSVGIGMKRAGDRISLEFGGAAKRLAFE